jgi:hypothetical protein
MLRAPPAIASDETGQHAGCPEGGCCDDRNRGNPLAAVRAGLRAIRQGCNRGARVGQRAMRCAWSYGRVPSCLVGVVGSLAAQSL